MNILSEYLSSIISISENDTEFRHRTALQNLLESIRNELATTHKYFAHINIDQQPNNAKSGAGAPDFLVAQNGLELGYIENKRVNANVEKLIKEANTDKKAQLARYLTLSDNLILTDYLRFLRIAKAPNGKIQITQEVKICDLNEIHATLKSKSALQSKQSELLEFFALFFSSTPKPIATAQDFALCLAQRTKLVKDTLIDNPQNPQIATLYQSFRDILYKDLDFEAFCDSFAQTLTYALFLARLNDEKGEIIDLYNVKKFIPKSFPLIRAMSGFLDNLDELDSLKWLINEILSIINHISPASITKELNKIAQKDLLGNYLHKDPYLHFYETFLSQYDPKLRELRGVYYTPFAVVSFIINAIDSLLRNDFKQNEGLGSALNNDNITLLDFATGTGTFLLEAFRKALESMLKKRKAEQSLHDKPKKLLSKFSGFEFLIAPYTIAHLKISQSFKEEFRAPLDDNERLNIYLTNTLYAKSTKDLQNQKSNLWVGGYEIEREVEQSQKLKNEQILIITGNPPYSGASANKGLFEDEVKIAYGLEPSKQNLSTEAQRIIKAYFANPDEKSKQKAFKNLFESRRLQNEKNPKWLLDDYVKFIRFAESKIESQDSGIIAIISNHGFIDNPTFRGMRYHLLNTFDTIYILDLHGNVKKKEKSPDGSKDDNVFDIQQGVCISVFVKSGTKFKQSYCHSEGAIATEESKNKRDSSLSTKAQNDKNAKSTHPLAQVYHYDLYGKRKDKYDFLQSNGLESIAWSVIAPKAPFYLFIPQNESLRTKYDKGISIKDIFIKSGVGICSKRDNIVFQDSREKLKELLLDFATKPSDELRRKYDIGEDSGGWKLEWAINEVKKYKDNLDDFITQCHYRPFDLKWTFYTNQNCGFMARPVYDIFKHFLGVENVGLVCDRGCKLQAIDNIFVANNIIDLHLVGSGSYIFPLHLVKSTSCHSEGAIATEESQSKRDSSLNATHFAQNDKEPRPKSLGYEEGLSHSPSTRGDSTHSPSRSTSGARGWVENLTPQFRTFIDTKYRQRFAPEVILGYIYAVLFHKDYREKFLDFLKIDFPRIPFVESKEQFLALSALGGQIIELHLMRGTLQSITEPLFSNPQNRNERIEKITYNAEQKRLYANESLYFSDVSEEVWRYKIGGYAVCEKYLKSHKGEVLDYAHFERIITTLHESLRVESQIAKIELE